MISDIVRYLKIKRISAGRGHPELVPVKGSPAYPRSPGRGAADGTGDFDSASWGGPTRTRGEPAITPGQHRRHRDAA